MVRDAGVRIVPLGVDAGAVSVADGAFACAGEVELHCGDTHLETLPARYRGRIADLLAVVTSAEIGQAGTGRGDSGGADPG